MKDSSTELRIGNWEVTGWKAEAIAFAVIFGFFGLTFLAGYLTGSA